LDQAHAAAEDKTVHQRQHRLAVMVDCLIEGVFLDEEVLVQAVAVVEAVIQRADITAGAEGFFAGATQHDGVDQRVWAQASSCCCKVRTIDRVMALRPAGRFRVR